MKKILLILCLLLGIQMHAGAVGFEPYPVPNYYSSSAVDFSINVGSPYYPYYCEPYYPYYCRRAAYSTGVYVSPYWSVGFGWSSPYRHYYHHYHRPAPGHHFTPVHSHHTSHHGGGHRSSHHHKK